MSKCKVIAIENQKGGTGKSTTALNLGVGLVREGKRVLLIDEDPQGSLSVSVGITRPDELEVTIANVLINIMEDEQFDDDYGIIHCEEGFDLLPSNIELSGVEASMITAMSREFVLKTYVDQIRENYDYILIDCSPSLGILPINALVAADSIIVPSQPRILSTKGLELLLRSYSKVQRNINQKLRFDGILFTMVDARTTNDRFILNEMKESVGDRIRIFQTTIPASVKVSAANLECKSVFAYDESCKVAEAYRQFTKEVLDIEAKDKIRLQCCVR